MARTGKTFKLNHKWYNISAQVVLNGENGLEIAEFSGEGFTTKNEKLISKSISETYEADGYKVVAIGDISISRTDYSETFRVEATTSQILAACRAFGLAVVETTAFADETDEADSDETDDEN